jgi:hypothetical protein
VKPRDGQLLSPFDLFAAARRDYGLFLHEHGDADNAAGLLASGRNRAIRLGTT